jgi:uncharacterized protein (DUF433 family)
MQRTDVLTVMERQSDRVSGARVFRGTRVPVSALFKNLRDGASVDEFLDRFSGVIRAQGAHVLGSRREVGTLIGLGVE